MPINPAEQTSLSGGPRPPRHAAVIMDGGLPIRRPGGRRRSTVLPLQAAYWELVVLPMPSPDFDRTTFYASFLCDASRERHHGGRPAHAVAAKAGS